MSEIEDAINPGNLVGHPLRCLLFSNTLIDIHSSIEDTQPISNSKIGFYFKRRPVE
jgi:hypothetical protein